MNENRIKWVGCIPSVWEAIKAKYIFLIRKDKVGGNINVELLSPTQKYGVIPQSLYEELSGMNVVKIDISNLSTFKLIKKGDFCISLRSFEGGFEYCIYDGAVSPAYTVFFAKRNVNDIFYKYMFKLQCFIDEMNSYSLSLRDGKPISFDNFGNTLIAVPPLEEQKAIADYLDGRCGQIDEISKMIKDQIETLEQYRLQKIREVISNGINGRKTFPKNRLKYICTSFSSNISTDLLTDERNSESNYPVYGASGLLGYYKFYRCDKSYLGIIKDGAGIGRINLYNPFSSILGTMAYLIPNKEVNINWLKYCVMSLGLAESIDKTTIPHIYFSEYGNTCIPFPSFEEQKAIADYLDGRCGQIDEIIKGKREQLEQLKSYKQSMIYEYVTGKKRVSGYENK